jgi:hypothetical protein
MIIVTRICSGVTLLVAALAGLFAYWVHLPPSPEMRKIMAHMPDWERAKEHDEQQTTGFSCGILAVLFFIVSVILGFISFF